MTTDDQSRSTTAPQPEPKVTSLKMLAPDTRAAIGRVGERVTVDAGAVLFSEDDQSNELYIIEAGTVVSYQAGGEGDSEWPVLSLGEGDIVGEMSFLDGGARQLTARAETDCTLLRVHPFDLLELEDGDHYYDNLRASVGITVVRRLRVGTELHVATLQHQLEQSRTQQQFGQFFVYIIALFSIAMIANNVIATQILRIDVRTQEFAWQYLLILLVPSFVVIKVMRIPLWQVGLTFDGIRKSMTEGAILSVAVIALGAILVVGSRMIDAVPDLKVTIGWSSAPSYLANSFLQELVGHGFMQTSFQRFLNDRRGIRSVFLSSTMFGVFHIHLGLPAVLATIAGGVLFGLFYLRHRNIFGVTLLHFIAGCVAFSIGVL